MFFLLHIWQKKWNAMILWDKKLQTMFFFQVGVGFKLKVIPLSSFRRGDATLVSSPSFDSWLPSKIIKIQKSVPYLPILDFLQKESANQFLPRGSSSISSAFLSNFRPTFIRQHWSMIQLINDHHVDRCVTVSLSFFFNLLIYHKIQNNRESSRGLRSLQLSYPGQANHGHQPSSDNIVLRRYIKTNKKRPLSTFFWDFYLILLKEIVRIIIEASTKMKVQLIFSFLVQSN